MVSRFVKKNGLWVGMETTVVWKLAIIAEHDEYLVVLNIINQSMIYVMTSLQIWLYLSLWYFLECCGSYQLLGCVPDLETRIELHELFGLYKFSYDVVNGAPVYEHIRGNAFLYRCTEKTCSHASWRVGFMPPLYGA